MASKGLSAEDRGRMEDVGFMTCMTITLLGNYAQTGHFGGPTAYTPFNVAMHLAGPELGGLRYDLRRPKHPFGDKFMMAAGHSVPTCYALWMVLSQAMERRHKNTGDRKYYVDPEVAILPVDALGFRRGHDALKNLLSDHGLGDNPLFAQAKARGIKALAGHAESIDVTNDTNGGPSGVGVATSAGKAAFWDMVGAPLDGGPKIVCFEGEFAMTEGHAQEVKTQAMAMQVGKRLRMVLSDNNAGIDDALIGGVISNKTPGYVLKDQWTSYGWNVFSVEDGADYDQIVRAMKEMEEWDAKDRRPMIMIAKTLKGYWPGAVNGGLGATKQITGYKSHPYSQKMNSEYFVALAESFEKRYGIEFEGIRGGAVSDTKERLIQFKTNIDKVMSVLDKNGLGDWIADRLVAIGDQIKDNGVTLNIDNAADPFQDERLRVANLPTEPQKVTAKNDLSGATKEVSITLFEQPGKSWGARRAISEVVKWMNHVTGNRFVTLAADLSESINVEHGALWGHYDPEENPRGTRIKAAIQEAGNVASAIGLVSQSASVDPNKFSGVWALSGTYGAFTPLMYTPARVWSQQNQDSRFRVGVLHILAGHSGPETAADGRTHFGIFATQVWKLFPRGQTIHLNFWDYNDVAAGYFAAAEIAARDPKVGIISIEVARPDNPVADRSQFADKDIKAASKGFYVIRDFAAGKPRHGYVLCQGASSTVNTVKLLRRIEEAGLNVKIVSCISEELFDRQPEAYRNSVLPAEASYDCMVVSTGTRRVWPWKGVGPLADAYSLTSDWDNQWLTSGLENDVIAEAHLDPDSIFKGIERFAKARAERIGSQAKLLA